MSPTGTTDADERTQACITIEGLKRQILCAEPYEKTNCSDNKVCHRLSKVLSTCAPAGEIARRGEFAGRGT
jgi:hypothetical protein